MIRILKWVVYILIVLAAIIVILLTYPHFDEYTVTKGVAIDESGQPIANLKIRAIYGRTCTSWVDRSVIGRDFVAETITDIAGGFVFPAFSITKFNGINCWQPMKYIFALSDAWCPNPNDYSGKLCRQDNFSILWNNKAGPAEQHIQIQLYPAKK